MYVIDLSTYVNIFRSNFKQIIINFLRHFCRIDDLNLSGTTRCFTEESIMKKCLVLLVATTLAGVAFAASAAQPLSSPDTGQLRASGTVSATGATNLSDLEDKLAEKRKNKARKALWLIPQAVRTRCMVQPPFTSNLPHHLPDSDAAYRAMFP